MERKFRSDLLTRPFSSQMAQNDTSDNNSLNLSQNMPTSHNISHISMQNSYDNFNSSIYSETNKTKRKPFDAKLSFSHNFVDEETRLSETRKLQQDQESKQTVSVTNENVYEIQSNNFMNNTHISNEEKSFIKTQSEILTKETLEKARLFNSQFSNVTPFWIKFFIDLDTNGSNLPNTERLQANSSYFKTNDKNKYVKNLVEMVLKDAELYDATCNHQKVKSEVKNNLKSLLITEIAIDNNLNAEASPITENDQSLHQASKTIQQNNITQKENEVIPTQDEKINEKLTNVLYLYNKLDDNEKNIIEQNSFNKFKNQLKNDNKESNVNKISTQIKKKLNKYAYSKTDLTNEEQELKLINCIIFDQDDFKEPNFNNCEFNSIKKNNFNRLLEIDRQLNKLDSKRYNTSIVTSFKQIQKDFNNKKEQRMKEIDEKYNKISSKFKSKEKKKTSIFDVKNEKKEKVKYHDYLKDKQFKKTRNENLVIIDQKINLLENDMINNSEFLEKKGKLLKELEDFHVNNQDTEEYKEKMNFRVSKLKKYYEMEDLLMEIENRQSENKNFLESLEAHIKKEEELTNQNVDEKWKENVKFKYFDLMETILTEEKDNKLLSNKLDLLEVKVLEDEKHINLISKLT